MSTPPKLNINFAKPLPATYGGTDAYGAWKEDPSPDNMKKVLDELNPVIDTMLTQVGDKSLGVQAKLMAREAVMTYNPKFGANLKTHVSNNLLRLYDLGQKRASVVHVPENQNDDRIEIQRFAQQYYDQNGFEPSMQEVGDSLKMNTKRVAKAIGRQEVNSSTAQSEKGEDMVAVKRDPADVWTDYVVHDLEEKNRRIFEWTTGYKGAPVLSKGEIAKRLGISGAAVSQRIGYIQSKLEEGYGGQYTS